MFVVYLRFSTAYLQSVSADSVEALIRLPRLPHRYTAKDGLAAAGKVEGETASPERCAMLRACGYPHKINALLYNICY